jgi:hypothetical protein
MKEEDRKEMVAIESSQDFSTKIYMVMPHFPVTLEDFPLSTRATIYTP